MKKIKQLAKRERLTKSFFASSLSVFILGLFSPLFFNMAGAELSNEEVTELRNRMSDQEGFVNSRLKNLEACRVHCLSNCRVEIREKGDEGDRDPSRCPDVWWCDAGDCRQKKGEYERERRKLQALKDHFIRKVGDLKKVGLQPDKGNESPLTQVRKAKNKMKNYAIAGAATAAILGMRAKFCCSTGSSCSCGMWSAMAGAAVGATAAMVLQRDKLRGIEKKMCGGNCLDNDSGAGNGDDTLIRIEPPDIPPYCRDHVKQCEAVLEVAGDIAPPEEGCAPEDTSCNNQPVCDPGDMSCQPVPPMPSDIMTQGLTGLYNSPAFYNPKDGKPPVIPKKFVSYKDFTPTQKRQIDKFLATINKQNKKWLEARNAKENFVGSSEGVKSASRGGKISEGADGPRGSDSDEEGSYEESLGEQNQKPADSKSAFAGGDSRSADSLEPDEPITTGSGRKNPLAEQMKKMLKNFYGGDGSGNDPLAEKSVQFGDDIVGVPEDNIFMMVHRRHRALDARKQFVGDTF